MTALLRKDIYVADKQARMLIVLAAVFSLIPNMAAFGSTYSMMVAFMIPLNSLAYDEKSKWDKYAAMLPYRLSELVGSKYLLGAVYTLLAVTIVIAGYLIRGIAFEAGVDWTEMGEILLMLLIAMVLMMNISLPLLFRFGTERGRILMIVSMGAAIGVGLGAVKIVQEFGFPSLPVPVTAAAAAAGAAGLTVVSIRLSMRFYKNRRDGKYD